MRLTREEVPALLAFPNARMLNFSMKSFIIVERGGIIEKVSIENIN